MTCCISIAIWNWMFINDMAENTCVKLYTFIDKSYARNMLCVLKVILRHEHILQIQYNPYNRCSQITFITWNFSQNVILMVYMYPTFHLHMHVYIMFEFGHFSAWISNALNFVLVKKPCSAGLYHLLYSVVDGM